jgi:Flp pilus assembly protein TadD/cell division septation protein DedD
MMRIADQARAAGDLGTAATLYRRVHDITPTDPRPVCALGSVLTDLHAYTEAVDTYRTGVQMNPNPVMGECYRGLAIVLLLLNQPDVALDTLQQAIARAPQDGRLYSAMGVTHDLMGRHDLAQQDYQKGMKLMPQSTGLRNNYGLSLALAGDYPAAIAALTELTLDSNASPRHKLNLALVYGLAGDDNKAAAIARTTLDEEAVKSNLAYYAMLRGMDDKARANAIMGGQLTGQVAVNDHPGLKDGPEDTEKVAPAAREPVSTAALDAPKPKSRPEKVAAAAHAAPVATAPAAPVEPVAPVDIFGGDPGDAKASATAPSEPPSPAPATDGPTKLTRSDADSAPTPAPAAAADQTGAAAPAASEPTPTAPSDQSAAAAPPASEPSPAAPSDQMAAATPPAGEAAPAPEHKHAASAATGFVVQVGSFASEGNAKKLADQLNQKGYGVAVVHHRDAAGHDWYAVRAGGYGSADEAAAAARHMHDAEQVPAVVVHQHGPNQA